MKVKVHLPNNSVIEVENGLSLEQIREIITSAGVADVALAPAVDATTEDGAREVRFTEPQGATKG